MSRNMKLGVAAIALTGMMAVAPVVAGSTTITPAVAATKTKGDYREAGDRLDIVGLADGGTTLVPFDAKKTGKIKNSVKVTGLTGGDTKLVGIDYRVQDGNLYGVGNNAASAGVYVIDVGTGVATLVNRLTVALSGTTFGVDFNPAANALRVVSDTGQNLRQPYATPGSPTVADGPLSYAAPAAATGVNGAAYTNNDLDPNTGTTLFDLDTALDQIAIQAPANAGSLAATGKLGLDAVGDTGFDIYSTLSNGSTIDVVGFATVNGSLYEVDVLTGKVISLGVIGATVTDIAIPLNQG